MKPMTELLQHQTNALQQHLEKLEIPKSVDESMFRLEVAKSMGVMITLAAIWEEAK